MTISHSPAPARSDVAAAASGSPASRPYLLHGRVLSAGAAAWAVAMAVVGLDPQTHAAELVFACSSGLFQVGLLFLLRTLWLTGALGEGRLARAVLRVETAAVALAMASTAGDGLGLTDMDQLGWMVLDAFWPLSMLGMFLIGIRIAVAGRWTGATRFWPMVAESWAVVTIPALGLFGPTVGLAVACGHLLVGYTVLGVLVSRKPA